MQRELAGMSLDAILPAVAKQRSVSDIVLAFGVVAIIALMILPLPLWVIDTLVAFNILIGVGLVLIAIYIASPLAFSSFPSVILLTTLFRLSLSIATTRLILLDADAGDIIATFGNLVVGGNMVVGLVVFLIITVVQFIVIAKGAERVAEVAARFTLDAMPGKQLSIDSDLRSGLLSSEEAREKRRELSLESQLHGSLDGAMKFVKGDAIAGIVILIVNILGGLTIGVLQRGMSMGDAMATYSLLTVGDGMVSQIPALLASIAAGLIITRTASDERDRHLGEAITRQFSAYPRVVLIAGLLAFLLVWVPGFPWFVFLALSVVLLGIAGFRKPDGFLRRFFTATRTTGESELRDAQLAVDTLDPPAILSLSVHPALLAELTPAAVAECLSALRHTLRERLGVPLPQLQLRESAGLSEGGYVLNAYDVCLAQGGLKPGQVFLPGVAQTPEAEQGLYIPLLPGQWQRDANEHAWTPMQVLEAHLRMVLTRNMGLFLGIQEVANLVNAWNADYPDLVKEMLRVISPQGLSDVLRRLVQEGISIRNLRDVFEAITQFGGQERDPVNLTEHVRMALRRQISQHYTQGSGRLSALLAHPELEDALRTLARQSGNPHHFAVDPEFYQRLLQEMARLQRELPAQWDSLVLLCAVDVRRHLRRLTEEAYADLPVLSYQELTGDTQITSLAYVSVSA